MKYIISLVLFLLSLYVNAEVKLDIPDNLKISQSHPRLIIDKKDFAQMKKTILSGENVVLTKMHNLYIQKADKCVEDAKPFTFQTNASGKLLKVSRDVLHELATCSYAYRFTNDSKYLNRAQDILEDVCEFPSWNPRHYLDVAEMAFAVSLAYDWLYPKLPSQVKEKCEKAIKAYLFKTAVHPDNRKFFLMKNNWGQVLNSSLACSAIAFYELDPNIAQNLIVRALGDICKSLESGYAPDGIYPEGAMYWNYGTSYQILMNDALSNIYGTDFGLSNAQGFKESTQFVIFTVGNLNRAFNYSDSSDKRSSVPSLWYFADIMNDPDIIYQEYLTSSTDKFRFNERLGFVYIYHASKVNVSNLKAPSRNVFSGQGSNPLVIARTGWEKNDIYLGTKGGSTRNNHSHMDAGSFIYESHGVRWICEPTYPVYELTENLIKSLGGSLWKRDQNSFRWKMYGYNNLQHSTLTINGKDHKCSGDALLVDVYDTDAKKGGCYDMTTLYGDEVKSVIRSIYIADNNHLEIVDSVVAGDSGDVHVMWNAPTEASVSITDDGIILSMKNKKMLLQADGAPVIYTTDMVTPSSLPEEYAPFYESKENFASFTYTVPNGEQVRIKTTLKLID